MKILILGAGFGGLDLATRLSDEVGTLAEVTLIDKGPGFIFGFSKLDVMFGKHTSESVLHPYGSFAKPGVRFVQATIESIDPGRKAVTTDAGDFEADLLVVALGADLDPSATPGLVESGHEFYTVAGAFTLRDVLSRSRSGNVVIGVTSTPFKCPPAPSETALLMHDILDAEGSPGQVPDFPRHAAGCSDPALTRCFGRTTGGLRRTSDRTGTRNAWSHHSTGTKGRPCSMTARPFRSTCSLVSPCTGHRP